MRATRMGLAIGAALAMALPATVASAGVSAYEDLPVRELFQNGEYALFTGPMFEQGCRGEGFSDFRSHVVRPGNGGLISRTKYEDSLHLYDLSEWGAQDAFDLIDISCTAVFTGEGPVPMPIASGEGDIRVRQQVSFRPDGGTDSNQSSVHGTLVTESGEEWSVKGRVKFTITFNEEGNDVETDVRFDELKVPE